jgi:Flp pilus assembly protein TadG
MLRFLSDRKGNVATTFAFALIPMVGATGAAIDYSRATQVRAGLQAATDMTALISARESRNASIDDIRARAKAQFDANYKHEPGVHVTSFTVARNGDELSVQATASVDMSITRLLGVDSVTVGAESYAMRGSKKVEVVLALDNTGSMASSNKLVELKKAATSLINVLESSSTESSQVKVGIVPFATSVRVKASDYKNANWIDFTSGDGSDTVCQGSGKRKTCTDNSANDISKSTWAGCIEDRASPYNTSDAPVIPGSYATMHTAISCRSSEGSLVYVQPLTNDFSALRTAISNMKAGGNTNVTIGVTWGHALLSNQAPFTEAVPFDDEDTQKFLIVLTDGENTQDRFDNCSGSTCVSRINTRTKAACDTVKAAGPGVGERGITVYTIRVIDGDADLLRSCASSTDKFFDVQYASQLEKVFMDIGNKISALRLSR